MKTAGQTCYASFGPQRTYNENAKRYFDNLSSSGHGSVFEHAMFSFLCYGISRSNTHEIVRHRAGTAFSQLSQRFVSGKVLRFVERPEYQEHPALHKRFEERIDRAAREYEEVADELLALQSEGDQLLSAEAKTDRRKRVQQTARSVLPNEAETILVLVGERPVVAAHDRDAHGRARRVRDPRSLLPDLPVSAHGRADAVRGLRDRVLHRRHATERARTGARSRRRTPRVGGPGAPRRRLRPHADAVGRGGPASGRRDPHRGA